MIAIADGILRSIPVALFLCCSVADDKKLTTTLKRIGVTNIPAIEEVNMFKNDGEVIHFVGPKGERHVASGWWPKQRMILLYKIDY